MEGLYAYFDIPAPFVWLMLSRCMGCAPETEVEISIPLRGCARKLGAVLTPPEAPKKIVGRRRSSGVSQETATWKLGSQDL
jgi:hypothetical protein